MRKEKILSVVYVVAAALCFVSLFVYMFVSYRIALRNDNFDREYAYYSGEFSSVFKEDFRPAENIDKDEAFDCMQLNIKHRPRYAYKMTKSLIDAKPIGMDKSLGEVNPWIGDFIAKTEKYGETYWLRNCEGRGDMLFVTEEYHDIANNLLELTELFLNQGIAQITADSDDNEGYALTLQYITKAGTSAMTIYIDLKTHDATIFDAQNGDAANPYTTLDEISVRL